MRIRGLLAMWSQLENGPARDQAHSTWGTGRFLLVFVPCVLPAVCTSASSRKGRANTAHHTCATIWYTAVEWLKERVRDLKNETNLISKRLDERLASKPRTVDKPREHKERKQIMAPQSAKIGRQLGIGGAFGRSLLDCFWRCSCVVRNGARPSTAFCVPCLIVCRPHRSQISCFMLTFDSFLLKVSYLQPPRIVESPL